MHHPSHSKTGIWSLQPMQASYADEYVHEVRMNITCDDQIVFCEPLFTCFFSNIFDIAAQMHVDSTSFFKGWKVL